MTSATGPNSRPPSRTGRPGGAEAPHRHVWRWETSFTLMELIVVLSVVSVVLALCAPSLRGFFASRQTADAARRILSLTKWARSEAVAQGRPCRLNVDSAAGAYWITVQQAGQFVSLNTDLGRVFEVPQGASIQVRSGTFGSVVPSVDFYPSGRNDVAAIEVQGRAGEVYQIVCLSATEPFRVISPLEAP